MAVARERILVGMAKHFVPKSLSRQRIKADEYTSRLCVSLVMSVYKAYVVNLRTWPIGLHCVSKKRTTYDLLYSLDIGSDGGDFWQECY